MGPRHDSAATRGVLVADVGGTHIRAAIVEGGQVVHRLMTNTPHNDREPTAVFDLMGQVLKKQAARRAVVGLPGRVNYAAAALEYAPNLPAEWVTQLRADAFRDALGIDVALANDADLAAVGEAHFGGGRGYDDVVYLTVSTGIGAGVLLAGKLVAGERSLAEIGHVIIDRVAARTGDAATVEQLGSGGALARDAAAAGIRAHDEALVRLAEARDPRLGPAWRDVREAVGYAAVAMAHLFSPQVIVIGGGLGRASAALLAAARQFLDASGPRGLPTPIDIRPSELGDDAGLHGAAAWAGARLRPSRNLAPAG